MNLPSFKNIKTVHVELTDKCNAQCPVCVRRFNGGPLNPVIKNIELDVNYFKDQLGEKFCKNIIHWDFCGTKGDPIACTELKEIVEYLKSCNPSTAFSIHTNGGFKSKDWWYEFGLLLKNTESVVIWGIDGLEDTNHIYRKNVKWNKLWENLNAFNDAGGKSVWQFLEFHHNKHQLPEIKQICKDKKIELMIKDPFGFHYMPKGDITEVWPIEVYDENGDYSYSILPKDADNDNINVIAIDEYGRELRKTGIKIHPELEENYQIECKIGKQTTDLYIDCEGAFIPCCYIGAGMHIGGIDPQLMEQFSDKQSFIPSKENPYQKIFQNKYYTEILPQGIKGELSGDLKYTVKCVETCGKCLN